jgi:hypothetical protein
LKGKLEPSNVKMVVVVVVVGNLPKFTVHCSKVMTAAEQKVT